MAVQWRSGWVAQTADSIGFGGQVPLVQLGLAERLRRTVIRWYVLTQPQSSSQVLDYAQYGFLGFVEATTGFPPAAPDYPQGGFFDSRDLIYTDHIFPWGYSLLTSTDIAPGSHRSALIDTDVSRGSSTTPHSIWFTWGLPPGHDVFTIAAFLRMWYRVLVETV